MLSIEDPADNFAYEVHQYFNADWTGTSADCQSRPDDSDFDADPLYPMGSEASAARLSR